MQNTNIEINQHADNITFDSHIFILPFIILYILIKLFYAISMYKINDVNIHKTLPSWCVFLIFIPYIGTFWFFISNIIIAKDTKNTLKQLNSIHVDNSIFNILNCSMAIAALPFFLIFSFSNTYYIASICVVLWILSILLFWYKLITLRKKIIKIKN